MRRCHWCAVRLRWWQVRHCVRCDRAMTRARHLGGGPMWCKGLSRADERRDQLWSPVTAGTPRR